MSSHQLFRVVTSAVIYNTEGQFLLAQRHAKDENLPSFWAIPAGHVEFENHNQNTLEDNLRREVKEEIGVDIVIKSYLDSNGWSDPSYKKITIAFLCMIQKGEPKALSETQDVKWCTLKEVSSMNLAPNVLRVITKASRNLDL